MLTLNAKQQKQGGDNNYRKAPGYPFNCPRELYPGTIKLRYQVPITGSNVPNTTMWQESVRTENLTLPSLFGSFGFVAGTTSCSSKLTKGLGFEILRYTGYVLCMKRYINQTCVHTY